MSNIIQDVENYEKKYEKHNVATSSMNYYYAKRYAKKTNRNKRTRT